MSTHAEVGQGPAAQGPEKVFWLNDPNIRGLIFQAITLVVVVGLISIAVLNAAHNLAQRNIAQGFGFLDNRAGFDLSQALIDYPKSATYGRAILVGFLNTLLVAVVGIIGATALGFLAGVARLSKNIIISSIATVYVETIRNVPLLLQMLFWYFGVLAVLPAPKNSIEPIKGMVYLNNRGLVVPEFTFGGISGWGVLIGLGVAVVAALIVSRWARQRQFATGQPFPAGLTALGLIIVLPILGFLLTGADFHVTLPTKSTFNLNGGTRVLPEFMALVLALVIYTGVFIAEIVRSGILAVSHGQTEAAHALGLSNGHTLRLVVIPQALRVIIPPLTNQFLNLTKNSSLAVAIGYPDLVYVGGTVLNQSGQAIEVIMIWMVVYLGTSITTSIGMNWYNRRVAIVER